MKYTTYPKPVKQEQRREFNEKLLYLIDCGETEKYQISADDIYNAYTGDGGLHGLERGDYENYRAYSEHKKEIENGQFFTPPWLARLAAESLAPSNDEAVADLTCVAGAFFNFMPAESNLYGCEIDANAYKVARFLYPKANIENRDIRTYNPEIRFDYVIGNPPFNLEWWVDGCRKLKSQLYYYMKAAELLKPKGIMAVIVPASFLSDEFSSGSDIETLQKHFHFLGQVSLPDTAFADMHNSQHSVFF